MKGARYDNVVIVSGDGEMMENSKSKEQQQQRNFDC